MNKNIGSKFDDFLMEEGMLDETEAVAIKKVIAYQLSAALVKKHLTKVQLAKEMSTSRAEINRILDPENIGITLKTVVKVAHALGKKVNFSLA